MAYNRRQRNIFGVSHASDDISEVVEALNGRRVFKAALELPGDFRDREGNPHWLFFTPLERHFARSGTQVIPIDDPALRMPGSLHLAMHVVRGDIAVAAIHEGIEVLERRLDDMEYQPPDATMETRRVLREHMDALDVLAAGDVSARWTRANRLREIHMLKEILRTDPDVVVVGAAHARELAKTLRGYDYTQLSSAYNP